MFRKKKNWCRWAAAGAAVAALLLGAAAYMALTPVPDGVVILEYHMVEDDDGLAADERPYNVPPAEFAAQLDYLQQQGYETITMQDYMRARKGSQELPERAVALTFDDGYEDNYTEVWPLLAQRDMKATIYMVTNDIGRPRYLDWNELRGLQAHGIEIGSHTANHQPLTTLDEATQIDELRLSKLLLEWNGIHTVFSFSYPNGAYDATLPAKLQQEEYLNAVTGDAGVNTMTTDPYLLQRVNIPHPRLGLLEFKLRLWKANLFTRLGWNQHQLG